MRERAEPHIGREGDLTAGRMSHESESRVGEDATASAAPVPCYPGRGRIEIGALL
jgi:hypothetical protein